MVTIASGRFEPAMHGGRPARWAATGRWGGFSQPPYDSLNLARHVGDDPAAVTENFAVVCELMGVAEGHLAHMEAAHGADVAVVTRPGVSRGFDALLTRTPGLVLVAIGADCVPVALIGGDGITVAVAHCGWRGLAVDVIGATVDAMRSVGAEVQHAILGPAACGDCYAVPPERVDELARTATSAVSAAAITVARDGQPSIDVRAGAQARLAELGVRSGSITLAGGCTIESAALFSYRRDGLTGRQALLVCTEESATTSRMAP